jgi:hypothetical protein
MATSSASCPRAFFFATIGLERAGGPDTGGSAMDEKVFDVTMIYIQNTSAGNYSLEFYCRNKNIKLNYANVEGIELTARIPMELKSTFVQMAENLPKVWNMKLGYPTNFKVSYSGRITIESM